MQSFNNFINNNFPGMNFNQQPMQDTMPNTIDDVTKDPKENNCGCCKRPTCPTTYKCCPPIVTCSKQVIDQYHITKQPYVHNYHTEVVHHYITQNEFIPNYTCSEVHVREPNNTNYLG